MPASPQDIKDFIDNADKTMPDFSVSDVQEFFKNEHWQNVFAKMLAYYVYRSSYIEELHTKYKISDEDMKALNQDIANRTSGIIEVMKQGEWKKLLLTLSWYGMQASEWDNPVPDTKNFVDEIKF